MSSSSVLNGFQGDIVKAIVRYGANQALIVITWLSISVAFLVALFLTPSNNIPRAEAGMDEELYAYLPLIARSENSPIGHFPGVVQTVIVRGTYAYIGNGNRFAILDVSNPHEPVIEGIGPELSSDIVDIAVSDTYAYVSDGNKVYIFDITDPTLPVIVGDYYPIHMAKGLAVSGDWLFVTEWNYWHFYSTFVSIDMTTPASNMYSVGWLETPGRIGLTDSGVVLNGNRAYIANGSAGLRIISTANPIVLTELGSFDTTGTAIDVAVTTGQYAYVADGEKGLRIVNIENALSPYEVGSIDTPGIANGVVVGGDHAFLADGERGVAIINVAVPAAPAVIATLSSQDYTFDVALSGNLVFVADGPGGLKIHQFRD